jgi:putative ABC transport system permease protein
MLKSYFKSGWRNLVRHKIYSSIKIGGLAIGITSCLLITLFIDQELNYDRHYPHTSRIYRVVERYQGDETLHKGVSFPAPMAAALRDEYPEIEKVARFNPVKIFGAGSNIIRRTDMTESFHEEGFAYADQSLLEMLSIPFVYGNPRLALTEPNSIVITQSKASKYFFGEDPLGKNVIMNNNQERVYTITGVIKDFPVNSHLQASFLMTLSGFEFWPGEQTTWHASNYVTYVTLRRHADKTQLKRKLSSIAEKYYLTRMIESGETDPEGKLKRISFALQPVKDIYMNTEGIRDDLPHGDMRYIWLFGSVAACILIIACINFINLSTAKSAGRAREVGIRKVVGSVRMSLVGQFLVESVLYSFLSLLLAVLLTWLSLSYFSDLVGKPIAFRNVDWRLAVIPVFGALVVGVVAGLYPSFYLSAFKPIQVLKGNISQGARAPVARSLLVVFQFTMSAALIIGTTVIYRQMDFVLNKELGFDKSQVLLVHGANMLGNRVEVFKDKVLQLPGVESASISEYLPVEGATRNRNELWTTDKTKDERVGCQIWSVDHDYIQTMEMTIVEGRNFTSKMPGDGKAMIVNQAMVKAMGMKDPIGQQVTNGWGGIWTVVGVVEDFHFESMRKNIAPLCLVLDSAPAVVSIKANTADMAGLIRSVGTVWRELLPDLAMRYDFLDERYSHTYRGVEQTGRTFGSFAILAIIVACLGLFGLSAFMVEQRAKEISIRLVLGASVNSILRMLTGNFVTLVLIALLLAAPLAWYVMQMWLEDFAYRIDLSWDIFVLSGLVSVGIALVTVSFLSVKAALSSPTKNLKSE